MQFELFGGGDAPTWEPIPAADAEIKLLRGFFDHTRAKQFFDIIRTSTPWRQDKIRVYGREHLLPRLQQWYGDQGGIYRWSGIEMAPEPWTPTLLEIKHEVEIKAQTSFNSLLINLYRDGHDTVSWHADDEPGLGSDPVIASVSLGATRDFLLRHKSRNDLPKLTIQLTDGSLLLMAGRTQRCWDHCIPRRAATTGERINLTFRNIATRKPKSHESI